MSSYNNDQVLRYGYDGESGTFIDVFVTEASGGLDGPSHTVFRDDVFIVVSARSDAVLKYGSRTGEFIEVLVPSGSGGLDYPHYMQFDDGILYLAGTPNNNILMYDADSGSFLGQLVAPGNGGLDGPRGLLILPVTETCREDLDSDGNVSVKDLLQLLGAWGSCD